MCKVGQNCNVGLEPQQMCHTPSQMDIYRSTLEVIFTITHHILSLHLIGSIIILEALLLSHVGKRSKGFSVLT